jgi:hypothetical protein
MNKKTKLAICCLLGVVLFFAALDGAYLLGYRHGAQRSFPASQMMLNLAINHDTHDYKEEVSRFPGVNAIPEVNYSHATN